jgi:hypothetical protein
MAKRGGLSDDPEVRKRQQAGLERGRAIAAERRRAGLPSKKKEAELEARVIEGGARGGSTDRDEGTTSRGDTGTGPKRRTERKPAAAAAPETDPVENEGEQETESELSLPFFAPLYTGKKNSALLRELGPDSS